MLSAVLLGSCGSFLDQFTSGTSTTSSAASQSSNVSSAASSSATSGATSENPGYRTVAQMLAILYGAGYVDIEGNND